MTCQIIPKIPTLIVEEGEELVVTILARSHGTSVVPLVLLGT